MCIWRQKYCTNCQYHFKPSEYRACRWKYVNHEKCVREIFRENLASCFSCNGAGSTKEEGGKEGEKKQDGGGESSSGSNKAAGQQTREPLKK